MEQENKGKEAQNPSEASTQLQSEKEAPKSLKPKSKIAKKSPINDLKPKKAKDTFRIRRRIDKRKNKNVTDGKKGNSSFEQEDSKKITAKEEKQEDISHRDDTGKSQHGEKDKEEIGGSDKSHQNQRSEDKSSRNQKNKENRGDFRKRGSDKSSRNHKNGEKHRDIESGASDKSSRDQKNKEKHKDMVKSQEKEKKKDKLAGLIFMCSKKTKPDCFHYRVMGVSASKKDFVLDIKPGLKLFLYDYDLKLMYGIYRASSSGGMKLEPKAFGGAFPAQVRFNVHVDCLPLPENIFKKAIKENYNEKNKFKFELTAKQVRKLSELFRPASIRPTALPVRSPPIPKVQDREVYAGRRESNRETFARDDYVDANSRRYNGLSHERDLHYAYGKGASSRREEAPRDLYLSEKEYRAYGLQGERKNLTTHHVAPLEPYQRGNEIEHQLLLRHPDPLYRDTIPASREPVPADSLYLNVGARHELRSAVSPPAAVMTLDSYTRDPYGTSHYGASVDRYLPPSRREDVASGSYLVDGRRETYLVGTDSLRRETDEADRLYSTYAANALSNFNQQHHYEGAKLELAAAPVSSRYSFAGPSLSYR